MRAFEFPGADRLGLAVLAGVLCVGTGLRVWLALTDDGLYWPDEIYQSLEPAHRLVFGYGLQAWEYIEGARTWLLPGIVAAVMGLAAAVGIDEPRGYLTVVRLTFTAVAIGTAFGSYLLARRLGAAPVCAACGAALFALVAPAIYFGPRAIGDTASALPVVLGFAFALRPAARRWERVLGASLLGLAVFFRLQNGLFCLGLLAILAGRRQCRELAEAFGVLVGWAALLALFDWASWGSPLRSALVYLRADILEGKSLEHGTEPFHHYLRALWSSMPLPTLLLIGLTAAAALRQRGLALVAVGFAAVYSALPHKEFRYILPVLPLFAALAGVGLEVVRQAAPRPVAYAAAAVVLLAGVWSAVTFRGLTFADLGHFENLRTGPSAYDDYGPLNRLLIVAGERTDTCGVKIEGVHLSFTGGYSYLHRNVPLYWEVGPPRDSGRFNYVVTRNPGDPSAVVARDGTFALVRLPFGQCIPDPAFDWRLP